MTVAEQELMVHSQRARAICDAFEREAGIRPPYPRSSEALQALAGTLYELYAEIERETRDRLAYSRSGMLPLHQLTLDKVISSASILDWQQLPRVFHGEIWKGLHQKKFGEVLGELSQCKSHLEVQLERLVNDEDAWS